MIIMSLTPNPIFILLVGITQAVYPLDEALIEFSTACDDRNFNKAIDILDNLELNPEVAMCVKWHIYIYM